MTEPPLLFLYADSLLSKFGFSDGDCPDAFLDWCEAGYAPDLYPRAIHCWREVLPVIVRKYLLPELKAKGFEVTVSEMVTNHNPVRADAVNGKSLDAFWEGLDIEAAPELPGCIMLSYHIVAREVREVISRKDKEDH